MNILTPIPNTYSLMLLAMLSLGSFNIARHIHVRWLQNKFSFIASNALVKGMIALFGLLIISLKDLFILSIDRECISIFLGIGFGVLVIFLENKLIRQINRKNVVTKNGRKSMQNESRVTNSKINQTLTLSSSSSIAAKGIADIRKSYVQYADNPDFSNYSLLAVISVAVAEEFLFRGYLMAIAYRMSSYWFSIVIIFVSLLAFAFSHVSTSWNEFLRKLPLSTFTTASYLITGSLIGPIITHLLLNVYAYFQARKRVSTESVRHSQPIGMSS